jgi:hypothetical protein
VLWMLHPICSGMFIIVHLYIILSKTLSCPKFIFIIIIIDTNS